MTVFFTADTHFGHANVIRLSKSPFADISAMNEALISGWNEVVGNEDVVWHLGDFAYGEGEWIEFYLVAPERDQASGHWQPRMSRTPRC